MPEVIDCVCGRKGYSSRVEIWTFARHDGGDGIRRWIYGVDAAGNAGEFDALGLGRFRQLEDLGLERDDG
ncbi:hypothetical protein CO666_13780 [Rhizobium chutanense]|uniref:Uncharacterized protein n=1 Tax=Rhizobium chutanense TaxID=2035448 RepID=A0A2A6JCI7_9HYPH|nr:hypothetical protein CO666_13780 [Rhizobium chutanense]